MPQRWKPLRIGEEISLECVSRGEGRMRPWPNITWYIGGERVRQTGHRCSRSSSWNLRLEVSDLWGQLEACKISETIWLWETTYTKNCRFTPNREGSVFARARKSWTAAKKMRATWRSSIPSSRANSSCRSAATLFPGEYHIWLVMFVLFVLAYSDDNSSLDL